ncbi:Nuclear mRNA export protein THP1 [Spathaspora sp. JA1]|nr:Nuclear mRNA export protein THP1 [Spathaspora sp. JA1]
MPGMDIISRYVQDINNTKNLPPHDQITQLTALLSIDPKINPYIVNIHNSNAPIPSEIVTIFDDDWSAFSNVVSSFIKLSSELDPWSLLVSFDLYTSYISDLSIAFSNNRYGWLLSNVVKQSINIILPGAIKLDLQLYYQEHGGKYRLNYLASIILKMFNNIRSQINDINKYKRDIILCLGNKLCFIYTRINQPLLCRNIFSNMNNTNLNLNTDFSNLEQLQYRYYLAKFYLIKYQLLDSFNHLQWCLLNTSGVKNLRLVLKLLIPISLIIGKIPNFNYIKQALAEEDQSWINMYYQLSILVRLGDLPGCLELINNHQQYLKSNNLLLLLENKLQILIMRNSIKQKWIMLNKPNILDYDSIKLDDNDDDYIIENVLVTLIDQNLIKGKIFTKLRKVALSKNEPFPNVYEIYKVKFLTNVDNKWM